MADTKLDKCSNHSNFNNKYPIKSIYRITGPDTTRAIEAIAIDFDRLWAEVSSGYCCELLRWHINRLCINWFDVSMQPNCINSLTYYRECAVCVCVATRLYTYSIQYRIDITFLFNQIISKAHKRRIAFAFWTKLCCFGYVPCSTFNIHI